MALTWLDHSNYFPPVSSALEDPNGLLAIGGDLEPERLKAAYTHGVFPWFSEEDVHILWWAPDPRAHLALNRYQIKRSLRKVIKKSPFQLTIDQDFERVIHACAEVTEGREETWITEEMCDAYIALHQQGDAHSIEVWHEEVLVGGLYGLNIGRCFFGESMFCRASDASKMAFFFLAGWLRQNEALLLDCQMPNPHLNSLGAETISRSQYQEILSIGCNQSKQINWQTSERFVASKILEWAP